MDRELLYHGIDRMDERGFQGQGVNILIYEEPESGHAARVEQSVLFMAPQARTFCAWFHPGHFKAREMVSYIVENDIHIVNISLAASGYPEAFLRTLDGFVRRGMLSFCAAGNERERGPFGLGIDVAITVGAASLDPRGRPRRDAESAVSRYLDFLFLRPPPTLAGRGTSFAAPMACGFAARLLSGYGRLSQAEMYRVFRSLARRVPLGGRPERASRREEHWNRYAGWGIPVYRPARMEEILREIHAQREDGE